jgi:acetoin utilization deacetylase AcuC-like enzyme
LEQENQYLGKKFSEKDEETSRLKMLNQRLLEQIKKLKEEESKKEDMNNVNKSDKEENSCLKNHNQNLLRQIKKLKNDKKSLENKLDQIQEEASKFLCVKIQVVEQGTNTDPFYITTQ